ncbi:MAG: ABC transporter ATP-binding protein [bacterium]|nr:ABC transporter ATP-binding protein [bacterium]
MIGDSPAGGSADRSPASLVLSGVRSGYGDLPILHGVSLEVAPGEIVSVIGPNGAGKSTLLKTLFGLLALRGGTMTFGADDLGPTSAGARAKLRMAYVPQEGSTFPELTVYDNLAVSLLHEPARTQHRRISEMLESFPALAELRRARAGTLSGGERQMLAIASAMISEPRFLALDEPTTGLAPSIVQARIADIVAVREQGTSVLWVIEESPMLCLPHVDRVYVMNSGVLGPSQPAEEMLDEELLQATFFGIDHHRE